MVVRQKISRIVGVATVAALVASGLGVVSVVSGVGVAPAAASPPPVPGVPTAVSLEADTTVFALGEKVTLTATPDEDVTSSSSYKVIIKDLTTGGVLGYCGKTNSVATWSSVDGTCTVKTSFTTGGPHTYQAYVAADTSLNDTQATSNEVVLERAAWTVTLSADKTTFAAGEQVTLTATPNQDIKASVYTVVIKDVTDGGSSYCAPSGSSTATWSAVEGTCTVKKSFTFGGPHTYQAYVAAGITLNDTQATSNEVVLERAAWTVTLSADKTTFAAGEQVTLTAAVNQDIKASGYMVVVKDETTGGFVGRCEKGSNYSATWSATDRTCTVVTLFTLGGPHTYKAYVVSNISMADLQGTSNDVVLSREAWTVTLSAENTVFAAGETVALTAAVNQDIRASSYMVVIKDETTGDLVGTCEPRGSYHGAVWSAGAQTCATTTNFLTGGPHTYRAYVAAKIDLSDEQSSSNQVGASRMPWTVVLASSVSYTQTNVEITLSATVNQDVYLSPYSVYIRDETTGGNIAYCPLPLYSNVGTWSGATLTCSWTFGAPSDGVHVYRAYVAKGIKLDDVQASSNGVAVSNGGGPTFPSETAGGSNPSQACSQACHGDPVNTATGEFFESVVDLSVPGLGPGLVWSRTYGSQVVGDDKGLGFGWSGPYTMRLVGIGNASLDSSWVDVVQENGSRVRFAKDGVGGFAAAIRVQATLERSSDGSFRFVRGAKQVFEFDAQGRLTRVEDLNGNGVTVSYDTAGHLVQVTDDAGRSLVVTWSGGHVSQVADPAGRTVSYAYSSGGDLVGVVQADGTYLAYGYTSHRVTSMTAADGGVTTNVYDSSGRVTAQTDPLGRKTTFAYATGGVVTVTDPAGHVTREQYVDGRLALQTVGYGTPAAATTAWVYGPTNQPVTVTDPLGQVTTATYDGSGHRTSLTDPLGRTTTWTYDGMGNMTSVTDPAGATWTFTFDQQGNATAMTSPTGAHSTAVVNPDGTVAQVTDPSGLVTSYTYDARGYRTGVTDPAGAVATVVWDAAGQVVSTTDPLGATTTVGYDQGGRVVQVTDPTGAVTAMGYDAAGRPTAMTDPLGATTTVAYDAAGQAVQVTDPAGAVTASVYDAAGQVVSVTSPTGAVTSYAYDAAGRLVTVTDPVGRVTTTTYDTASQVTAVTTASGAVWAYAYDAAGQNTTVTDPAGAVWTTTYDAAGRPATVGDPLGRTATTAYNSAGQPTSVTRPDGSVVTWTLNAAGQTTAFADPSGTTTYAYDNVGRPTSVTDPAGRTTTYAWDLAGQLTATTKPGGATIAHTYDAAGRRTTTTYPDATDDVTWTYDAAGQVQQVSDGTSYTYTTTGLVASVTRPTGTVTYTYDAAGRPTGLVYPGGQQVTYTWDGADQLAKVTDWAGGQYAYTWTDDAQVASVMYPNGVTTAWDHDSTGQTTAVTTKQPDGTELLALVYTFDDAGQVATGTSERSPTGRSPPAPATTASQVTFDPLGRLDTVTGTGAGAFTWDSAGLLTGTADGRSLAYDTAGRLAAVARPGTGTTIFGHDVDGNRTTATTATPTGTSAETLGWDAAGRLVWHTGATTATAYTYDATGLRTSATTTTTGGTSTSEQYVWDTTRAVPTVLVDAEHTYVYGLGDTPLAQVDTNGDVVYLHTDLVGSVRTATADDTHAVCDADYDPYGQPQPVTADPCAGVTRFGYAGQYTDPTGLQYLRNRYYDPDTAQFLSVDPLVEVTGDPYGYAGGNPLQNTDPLGLDFWQDAGDWFSGFGDNVTFGGTKQIRRLFLIDDVVNYCSYFYTWGGYGGTIASVGIPVGGGSFATKAAFPTFSRGASSIASRWKAMKPYLHEDLGVVGAGVGGTRAAANAKSGVSRSVDDVLGRLSTGRNSGVRTVGSDAELDAVYASLTRDGKSLDVPGYNGSWIERSDGVRIGLREASKSGGRTIDIRYPDGTTRKVHIK